MEYRVLTADSVTLLMARVCDALKGGWTPQGGVSVTCDQNGEWYAQAMVRNVG